MSINDPVTSEHPLVAAAARLSDDGLIARVEDLARTSRAVTVDLLAHLGELERRKLHRGQGCGRLFAYCTEVLKFSETEAYHRLQAARAARRFPLVLDVLSSGRVNLTTIRLLAPHFTEENHRSLLEEAAGLKRHEVEKIVARLNPRPDVPSVVRKLPARRTPATEASGADVDGGAGAGASVPDHGDAVTAPAPAATSPEEASGWPVSGSSTRPVAPPRGTVAPLRPSRYKLEVTLGEEEHDDLRWLQDAMRREIPDGDPAALVRAALGIARRGREAAFFRRHAAPAGFTLEARLTRRFRPRPAAGVDARRWTLRLRGEERPPLQRAELPRIPPRGAVRDRR